MKLSKNRTAFISICLICNFFSCGGSRNSNTAKQEIVEDDPKILITFRESKFKKEIVNRIVTQYESNAKITVIDIADLDKVNENDYDALTIMGARMGWLMFSAKERRFIRRLKEPQKTIMVMTAAVSDWQWQHDKVDIITCASKPENLDPLFHKISQKLDSLIKAVPR